MNAKPFFVLLVFVLFIAVFASGAVGDANLTDGGQSQVISGTSSSEVDANVFAGGPSSRASAADTIGASNSPCASTYTVKSGDTLSRIAQTCALPLKDLLAVNTSIKNANLIAVGQKITIYKAAPIAKPTATKQGKPSPSPSPSPTSVPGVLPGGTVTVEVHGFPPNAEVQVAIGKDKAKATNVQKGKTDAAGNFTVTVPVPKTAKVREKWTVTITTVKLPQVKVTSAPFDIGSK
jgi:LysM repeat protein